jgi:hypothetical protein
VFQCVGWVGRRTPPQSGSCPGPRPSAGRRTATSPSPAGSTTQAIHTCLSAFHFRFFCFRFSISGCFSHWFPLSLTTSRIPLPVSPQISDFLFSLRFILTVSYIRISAVTFLLPVIRFQLSPNGFQYKLPQCTLRAFSLTEQKRDKITGFLWQPSF